MRKRGNVYVHMYRVGLIIISFVLSLPSSNDIRVQCHLADAQILLITMVQSSVLVLQHSHDKY